MSDDAVGHGTYIGFGEQVTVGVPVTPTHFLRCSELVLEPAYERLPETHLGNPAQLVDEHVETWLASIKVAGPIVVPLGYNNASLLLLKHCLGAVSSSGAGPTWEHVFTTRSTVPTGTVGLTMVQTIGLRGPTNRQRVYQTVAPDTWELAWEAGKRTTLKMGCVGGQVGGLAALAGSPSFDSDPPISAYQDLTGAGFTLGGVKVPGLESFKVSGKRSFVAPPGLGTLYGQTPVQNGPQEIMVDVAFRWSDNLVADLFENGSYVAGAATFTDGTRALEFDFARLQVMSHPLSVSDRGLIRVQASLKAMGSNSLSSVRITATTDRETL